MTDRYVECARNKHSKEKVAKLKNKLNTRMYYLGTRCKFAVESRTFKDSVFLYLDIT